MTSAFSTPMMKQYLGIKKKYQDCLLLYRMGDFYELFLDDALTGAKVLGITLTSRSKGKDGRIPMAGVPYHAVDTYLSKLVQAGYKVAICEQLSEPNTKGLVERDVVRVVTPGTVLDEKALEKKENNYICAITLKRSTVAIALCDISTGEFVVDEQVADTPMIRVHEYIDHFQPAECLVNSDLYEDTEFLKTIKLHHALHITHIPNWQTQSRGAYQQLTRHFGIHTLESFEIHSLLLAQETAAILLAYISDTQKGKIPHIKRITRLREEQGMHIDRATQLNLELFTTIREHNIKGSLLSVLDKTHTAMGGRMIKRWILEPLFDYDAICERQNCVELFVEKRKTAEKLAEYLDAIHDIERMLSRLSVGIGNARDLLNLHHAIEASLSVEALLDSLHNTDLDHAIRREFDRTALEQVSHRIQSTFLSEPKITLTEGGIIATGVDSKLDELRELLGQGNTWLQAFEQQEKERTSISSLKVRFNSVFGYYIEISHANTHLVPRGYIRKQTLVNGERYITPELKTHEEKVIRAQEESYRIEYEIYTATLAKILEYTQVLQRCAAAIGKIDCIASFADVARLQHYCKPKMLFSSEIRIRDGRHPVVENLITDAPFVPNSVHLDSLQHQLLIITGPNMAGKSVFARQVALIVLLAHIGSFVPAKSAHIGLVDRIFVRSGASDMITSGLSTFMVEMVETATILHHATEKSLIVMDEIGRGTSTYDGISIAWAIASYLAGQTTAHAKTLFATHYHELQELADIYPTRIENVHMEVLEKDDGPYFTHTLVYGKSTSSFGIAVASRAGIPKAVISLAQEKLKELEQGREHDLPSTKIRRKSSFSDPIHQKIRSLSLSQTTPLEALNLLAELQQKLN